MTFIATTMKVKVRLLTARKETKTVEMKKGSTVSDVIKSLGLYPDAWIPVRGDTPIPLDGILEEGDELKLIAVVSGG